MPKIQFSLLKSPKLPKFNGLADRNLIVIATCGCYLSHLVCSYQRLMSFVI